MAYARESFRSARKTCDFVVTQFDESSPIHHQLCVAIAVIYARPFTTSDIVGALSDKVVPNEWRSLHDQLMELRDQVAAHSDADAWPHGRDGPPANNVQVIITSDGHRSLAIYELKFSLTAINGITALCDVLIDHTTNEVNSIWGRLHEAGLTPTMPGSYVMNLEKAVFVPTA